MISLLPALLFTASFSATPPAPLLVRGCKIDEMYAFNTAACEISISNRSDHSIRVFDARPLDESDSITPSAVVVEPNSTAYLTAKIRSNAKLGGSSHSFEFQSDIPKSKNYRVGVYAFVMSGLDQGLPEIDFGAVDDKLQSEGKEIKLTSSDVASFRITKIIEAPNWLQATLGSSGDSLSVSLLPTAEWGLQIGYVKLAVNLPEQTEVWVKVKADIHGEIVPSSNPLDLGMIHLDGTNHSFRTELTNRSGKKFRVGSVRIVGVDATANFAPCSSERRNCQTLIVNILDNHQVGAINGRVIISFPDFEKSLNLGVWGLVLPNDFKIKAIDKSDAANGEMVRSQSSRATRVDLKSAVKNAVVAADAETPVGSGPLLKWTVANGVSLHGFQIFRATNSTGPFVLLNKRTVLSTSTLDEPVSYQYRDNTAKHGMTYWYYIGMVFNDGHKQQLSGPQKVIAK